MRFNDIQTTATEKQVNMETIQIPYKYKVKYIPMSIIENKAYTILLQSNYFFNIMSLTSRFGLTTSFTCTENFVKINKSHKIEGAKSVNNA